MDGKSYISVASSAFKFVSHSAWELRGRSKEVKTSRWRQQNALQRADISAAAAAAKELGGGCSVSSQTGRLMNAGWTGGWSHSHTGGVSLETWCAASPNWWDDNRGCSVGCSSFFFFFSFSLFCIQCQSALHRQSAGCRWYALASESGLMFTSLVNSPGVFPLTLYDKPECLCPPTTRVQWDRGRRGCVTEWALCCRLQKLFLFLFYFSFAGSSILTQAAEKGSFSSL